MFDVVERPNGWAREQHAVSQATANTEQQRRAWWEAFNEHAAGNPEFSRAFRRRKPSKDHWMSLYLNTSLCHIEILQQRRDSQLGMEVRIPDSKPFFAYLEGHRAEVEEAFGGQMLWVNDPGTKACRVLALTALDYGDWDAMPAAFAWAEEKALALRGVLLPLIADYQKQQ